MKRQFIPDKEISLSKENDYLKTGVYADNLTKIIKNTPLNEVFTVGLFGNWGTGKSSIIETCKNQIECENPKIKFITYDAWKYANDSFRRMFLLKVQEELRQEQTDEMMRFYQSENAEAKPKQVLNVKGLASIIIALVIIICIIWILPFVLKWFGVTKNIVWDWQIPVTSVLTLLGIVIPVINGLFHNLKISINKPSLFAPEQFENCFKQMMEISLRKENCLIRCLRKIVDYVQGVETTITNLEKIIIVIDNIDRCHSAMAYQLLTDVKTFLSNEKYNIVFVIPVDDEALKKHLFSNTLHSADQCNTEKEEFLRKFFNVTLRIKPHQTLEMGKFAREVNKKYSLGFKSDTLALAAKEFATNPRRIIQLFNNLSAELSLYPNEFASKNESIICAVIILREEYNEFYKDAVNNVKLLKGEYLEKDKYYKNKDKEVKDEYEETFSFMRMADSYFKSSEISNILQILTNSPAQFSSIPIEVQKEILTFKAEKAISLISEHEELKANVIQFIQYSISEESKYGSESQLANWLNFVSLLQDKISIERSDLVKLDNDMSQYYETIIPKSTNADSVCSYAKHLSSIELNDLKDVIYIYITSDYKATPNNYKSYAEAVLKYFNDEKDSKVLTAFADKYFSSNFIDRDIEYTTAQKKYLFSDTLVEGIIDGVTEIIDDDRAKELLWLFRNKPNISNETYGVFFSQISTSMGDMRNKTKEEILSIIEYLMPFVSAITPRKLQKEPAEFYRKLFTERVIPTTIRGGYSTNTDVCFLNECIGNEEESKTIINFISQIYEITSEGSVDTSQQFETLMETYRTDINSKLVELLTKGFTLVPLFDIIISDVNYSSDDSMKLITNYFTQKDKDGKLYLSQEQISGKIGSLLDNIKTENVTALVTKIIKDDTLKTAVANEIINRNDHGFNNSLPTQLSALAINMFYEASASDYATNFSFLHLLAEKGDNSQKSILVRLLIGHINNNNHFEEVLSILEIMSITKKTDKDSIAALLNSHKEKHNNIDTDTKSKIDAIITKFSTKKKGLFSKKNDE